MTDELRAYGGMERIRGACTRSMTNVSSESSKTGAVTTACPYGPSPAPSAASDPGTGSGTIGLSPVADAIRLIDVLWLERGSDSVAAAFDVEHTTSILSGIVRMLDLASAQEGNVPALFLVAPDEREGDVRAQLARPAFRAIASLRVRYVPYGELDRNKDAIARFGAGLKGIEAIARELT